MKVRTEARITERTLKALQVLCRKAKSKQDLWEIQEYIDDLQAGLWVALKGR